MDWPRRKNKHFSGLAGKKHTSVDWPKKETFSGLAEKEKKDWPKKTLQWNGRQRKEQTKIQWIGGKKKQNTFSGLAGKKGGKTLQWIGQKENTSVDWPGNTTFSAVAENTADWPKNTCQCIGRKIFSRFAKRKSVDWQSVDWPKKRQKNISGLAKKNRGLAEKKHISADWPKKTLQWIDQKKRFSGLAEKEKHFSGHKKRISGLAEEQTLQWIGQKHTSVDWPKKHFSRTSFARVGHVTTRATLVTNTHAQLHTHTHTK